MWDHKIRGSQEPVIAHLLFNLISKVEIENGGVTHNFESGLHSKWLLLLKIEVSLVIIFCFITNQNELKFNCSYMVMSSLTYILGFSVRFFVGP
jgi:hypothetical protein